MSLLNLVSFAYFSLEKEAKILNFVVTIQEGFSSDDSSMKVLFVQVLLDIRKEESYEQFSWKVLLVFKTSTWPLQFLLTAIS